MSFIVERLRNLLLEQGNRFDAVDAILAAQGEYPARASRAVEELSKWVTRSDWNTILPAFARCVRITREFEVIFKFDSKLIKEEAEKGLYHALLQAEANSRREGSVDDFLAAFVPMIGCINRFFDEVLVMDENELLRSNRLGLLQRIVALSKGVIDMSRLEGF